MQPWISSVFGLLGTTLSFLQYVSPMPTFYRIAKNKSTEDFESLPYICTVLNSSLWTYYGIIKPDYYVCVVNGFGAAIEAVYVLLFIIYAPPTTKSKTAITAGILNIGVVGGAILSTYFGIKSPDLRIQVAGLICLVPMVAMYASPLAILETVIKTKSVEYMPFGLSFVLVLTGGVWTIYAILQRDFFLGVPNGIGFVFGAIQIVVYCIYRYKYNKGSHHKSFLEGSIVEATIEEGLLTQKS